MPAREGLQRVIRLSSAVGPFLGLINQAGSKWPPALSVRADLAGLRYREELLFSLDPDSAHTCGFPTIEEVREPSQAP